MFTHHKRMIGRLYLAGDALVAVASFALAYTLRAHILSPRPLYSPELYYWIVPLVAVFWVGTGVALGVYRDVQEEEWRSTLMAPLKVSFIAGLLLFAAISAFRLEYISRLLLGFFVVIDFALMVAFRLAARRLSVGGFRHILLVGDSPQALEIARTLEAGERRGLRLEGFALPRPAAGETPALDQTALGRAYPVHRLEELPDLLRRHVIDEVIFAVSKDDLDRLEPVFLMCEEEGVKTRLLLSFFPHLISRIYLERLRDMPMLTFSTTPEEESLLLAKRALDFALALAMLAVLLPIFLILAVLIKLTSHGPVCYRQIRCGLGGRKFSLYKFRSMHADADLRREELEALNEADGPVFKIKDDPRCTPAGRFMRRFSLDELPQLFNILRGEMSFVGPRPPLPEEVEKYEPWQRRRLRMQPGLTCLWALEGRSQLSFRRWMELDLQYIDNWSPALDLKIFLKTIPVVLLGRGAS
ncbi:MAG: sugar transferase [Acidobacteria bacterium]|nr:sugar transferase [Acidobacteriota bacterium]